MEGVLPSLAHPRSHLDGREVWKVCAPLPVHQSPWQGIELDGSSPFQPKPFHGENPALLHDPRRFLGAALGVWGAPLADSWSPTAPASSSLGMTRRCP